MPAKRSAFAMLLAAAVRGARHSGLVKSSSGCCAQAFACPPKKRADSTTTAPSTSVYVGCDQD
jgi:hypothetical protein